MEESNILNTLIQKHKYAWNMQTEKLLLYNN